MKKTVRKRFLFIGAILIAATWVLTPGPLKRLNPKSATAHKGPVDNTLYYDIIGSLGPMDPMDPAAQNNSHIFPLFFSYLFVQDESGVLKPDLATDWEYDADEAVWTILLRKDAYFHDGRPLTADDVAYSLNKWMMLYSRGLEEIIAYIEPVSDTTVLIFMHQKDPDLPRKIWDYEIIPKPGTATAAPNRPPIGSGPFKFHSREGNRKIVLTANPAYYNGRPSIDRVVYTSVESKEKSWVRLLAGEADVAFEMPPENLRFMRNIEHKFYFEEASLNYYSILLYNTHDPLFSDPKVRRALSHAIDRKAIVEKILRGFGSVANSAMGNDSPFHDPTVNQPAYDPKKSLELLTDAGWKMNEEEGLLYKDDKCFEFDLHYGKGLFIDTEAAQFIQLCLAEVGIRARLKPIGVDSLLHRYVYNSDFQAVLTEFPGLSRIPEELKEYWVSLPDQRNKTGGFSNHEVAALIQKAIASESLQVRESTLQQVDRLLTDLQPGTFLFQKNVINVMSRRITPGRPFSLSIDGIYKLQFASIRHDGESTY